MDHREESALSRRDLLKLGGVALAASALPVSAEAQTPKRGGVFRVRQHVQPVHFDPHQTIAFPTMMALSYCMSRLVRVKAGASVVPGTQPIENDLLAFSSTTTTPAASDSARRCSTCTTTCSPARDA